GLITPKVQFPNLIKHPQLVAGLFLASIICAPIATTVFHFKTSYELAGLGLNSLIALIAIWGKQGNNDFFVYLLMGIVLPAIITFIVHQVMLKLKWVNRKDLKMEVM
ncbi:PTS sugar transporter subunit IIC, partial [Escherichia coli]|nr:PTS sugar transporter subunit IIC [Escherichia coli]